jgi:hypothetical protein
MGGGILWIQPAWRGQNGYATFELVNEERSIVTDELRAKLKIDVEVLFQILSNTH